MPNLLNIDTLTGALIGLARATIGNEDLITSETDRIIMEALSAPVNCNTDHISMLLKRVQDEKKRIVPDCASCLSPCGRTNDYDMQNVWNANEDVRSLKSLILLGIRGIASYTYYAQNLGYTNDTVNRFFYRALNAIGMDHWGVEDLLPVAMQVGEIHLHCIKLPDPAHTEA